MNFIIFQDEKSEIAASITKNYQTIIQGLYINTYKINSVMCTFKNKY